MFLTFILINILQHSPDEEIIFTLSAWTFFNFRIFLIVTLPIKPHKCHFEVLTVKVNNKLASTKETLCKVKKKQVILSALCLPYFVIQCGLSTLNRCSLYHYGPCPRHTISWNTINQGLLQLQGDLCPNQSTFNHHSRG